MSNRIIKPLPMQPCVMPTIFASALYDVSGKQLWINPDLVNDEVDEVVIFENEKWLQVLDRIATLERVNAKLSSEGPGTVRGRFNLLMSELEKRFPHSNPLDSTKAPEKYMLEAIDAALQPKEPTK